MKGLIKLLDRGARLITISCDGKKVYYHFFLKGEIITKNKSKRNLMSLCKTFPGAELYEREIMEKFGVMFENHPKPKKLFT
ncbi:MAG: NADH-quinone oxidoreductase subunit C [Candidatus Altiarchaeota archaeon]|nr:NADH-quinone oxidoreductase subunit C [Candidatus Altiarchaeota archaeon]